MIKKENFLFFAVAGLAIIYGILALVVFLTRGRFAGVLKKKLTVGMLIIMFSSFIGSGTVFGQTLTPSPTPLYGTPPPTPSREPLPLYGIPGFVEFDPARTVVPVNSNFSVAVDFSTTFDELAAYSVDITYDESLVGVNDVRPGADGFMSHTDFTDPGTITVTGFDPNGLGPAASMEFFIIDFISGDLSGTTHLEPIVDSFTDLHSNNMFTSYSIGSITVKEYLLGDVDDNDTVDIVDALKIARYTVGNVPPEFNEGAADVNKDGDVNIVDALMVARKFVGLIDEFPQG